MSKNLIERTLKSIRNYEMVNPGDTVLVAVSGGPDSVFLLHALSSLKNKLGISKLLVCNLDHGLRGKESKEDSLFVKKLACGLGLEFIHKRISKGVIKRSSISLEESARKIRYEFFINSAKMSGANVIATGHTLDDQAETVLMRLIKGASLKGIIGISPVRSEGDIRFIRPIIELEKCEIEKCLDAEARPYRVDRTNKEPVYFRNIVRSEIMPFLEKYNPRLKRALFSLADHLREDFEFIKDAKDKVSGMMRSGKNGILEISLKDIVIQPKALQKEILRDSLDKIGGEVKKLSFRHWKEMEGFLKTKRKGNSLDLPGGIRISRTGSTIQFHKLPPRK